MIAHTSKQHHPEPVGGVLRRWCGSERGLVLVGVVCACFVKRDSGTGWDWETHCWVAVHGHWFTGLCRFNPPRTAPNWLVHTEPVPWLSITSPTHCITADVPSLRITRARDPRVRDRPSEARTGGCSEVRSVRFRPASLRDVSAS